MMGGASSVSEELFSLSRFIEFDDDLGVGQCEGSHSASGGASFSINIEPEIKHAKTYSETDKRNSAEQHPKQHSTSDETYQLID